MRDFANLSRVDLNLLVSLQVLVEEGSVSAAARRLFITQSAMSRTLARLRQAFDDPLFIRLPHGLKPTPRALEISARLGPVLESVAQCFEAEVFEPSTFRGQFVIESPSTVNSHWLAPFLQAVLSEAPGLRIRTQELTARYQERLVSGDIDFALHLAGGRPMEFASRTLFAVRPVCILRDDHPLADEELTPANYARCRHVSHYVPGAERLDAMLPGRYLMQQHTSVRSVVYEGQDLNVILDLLRSTDLLFTAPHTMLGGLSSTAGLQVRDCTSLFGDLALEVELLFDRANEADPAYRWLVDKIVGAGRREHRNRQQLPSCS